MVTFERALVGGVGFEGCDGGCEEEAATGLRARIKFIGQNRFAHYCTVFCNTEETN